MITVKPFSIEILSEYKAFFLLDQLPKGADSVDVWVKTPVGKESVDFVDVFQMKDGSLLAAWKHPYQKLPLHNLEVFCNGNVQILNLYTVERIIDIYDRPVDADMGTFIFCPSTIIPSGDWRCDQSMYGPKKFDNETVSRVIENAGQIVYYESFLNVNGVGHVMYLESSGKSELANEKLNNSVVPATGRTLQECLRLIYEWSVLAQEPFNSKEEAPLCSYDFVKSLKLSDQELATIESLTPMQVSKFISGSNTARLRDMDINPLSEDVANIVFKRMAASSLSFIVSLNPGIWELGEVIQEEHKQLASGIERFRDYYQLPEGMGIDEHDKVLEHAFIYFPKQKEYVHTQLRGFKNKADLLRGLSLGYEKTL